MLTPVGVGGTQQSDDMPARPQLLPQTPAFAQSSSCPDSIHEKPQNECTFGSRWTVFLL